MTACKECGKDISDRAKSCPSCGAPVTSNPKQKMSPFMRFLGGVVVVVMVSAGIFGAIAPQNDEKAHARGAIDVCWKEQSKKSLDPGSARFIAGACEKMEADFKDRYGFKP